MSKNKIVIGFGAAILWIGRLLPRSESFFGFGKIVRRFGAKLFLSQCGKNVNIEKGATFSHRCSLGNNSGIGVRAQLGEVHIGNDVMMGPDCVMLSSNHEFSDTDTPMNRQGVQKSRPIFIGNDVWIGQRVIVLPGIRIGNGVIIGAGAVVTHDVRDYDVVAGNPAKVIRNRKDNRGELK